MDFQGVWTNTMLLINCFFVTILNLHKSWRLGDSDHKEQRSWWCSSSLSRFYCSTPTLYYSLKKKKSVRVKLGSYISASLLELFQRWVGRDFCLRGHRRSMSGFLTSVHPVSSTKCLTTASDTVCQGTQPPGRAALGYFKYSKEPQWYSTSVGHYANY